MAENESVKLDKLLFYLEGAESGFCIVEVNEAFKQGEIIDFIKQNITEKKIGIVDFKKLSEDVSHLTEVRRYVENNSNVEVVIVQNLHTLANSYGGDLELVKDLNLSRDVYAGLRKLLVFFFPTYFVDHVAQEALDFWDFVPVSFSFIYNDNEVFQTVNYVKDMADEKYLRNRAEFLENILKNENLSNEERLAKIIDLAEICNGLYLRDKAISNYLKAQKIAGKLGKFDDLIKIYRDIGVLYNYKGQRKKALHYLELSLKLSRSLQNRKREGEVYSIIAKIYISMEKYSKAYNCLMKSMDICEEIGDKACETQALNNLGRLYRQRKMYDKALEYFNKSLNICRNTGDRKCEGQVQNNLGHIYKIKKQYDSALDCFESSLKIRQELGDKLGEAGMLNNISEIHKIKGDYEKALKYLHIGLSIAEEIRNRQLRESIFYNINLINRKMYVINKSTTHN